MRWHECPGGGLLRGGSTLSTVAGGSGGRVVDSRGDRAAELSQVGRGIQRAVREPGLAGMVPGQAGVLIMVGLAGILIMTR